MIEHCRPQQEAALAAHGRWLDSSALDAAEKEEARSAMTRSVRDMRRQIIAELRRARARRD